MQREGQDLEVPDSCPILPPNQPQRGTASPHHPPLGGISWLLFCGPLGNSPFIGVVGGAVSAGIAMEKGMGWDK